MMQIIKVKPVRPELPIAISIDEHVDISMLNEVVRNTYGSDAGAWRRGEGSIGAGIIDIVYGGDYYDTEVIHPNQTGWLVLSDCRATFHRDDTMWQEFERAD